MTSWETSPAATMSVVHDPLGLFATGATYTVGDISGWMEGDAIPDGTVLRNYALWCVREQRLYECDGNGDPLPGGEVLDAVSVLSLHPQMPGGGVRPRTGRYSTRRRVLRALHEWWEQHRLGPTIRDLADELGLGKSTVRYHLQMLADRGLVEREVAEVSSAHRAVFVTTAGMRAIRGG